MRLTVLGASGFIGGCLSRMATALGHDVHGPSRAELPHLEGQLGHVVYAIGLTADFRRKPFETVEAHVTVLARLMERTRFDSFTYLSSTRVYALSDRTTEDVPVSVLPADADHLYNATKIAGESLCLSAGRENVRVVRLSNVYGADFESENFLTAVLRDAVTTGRVELSAGPDGEKDYVHVDDVTDVLLRIAAGGRHRIYNIGSGENVSNGRLLAAIAGATGCEIRIGATTARRFPPIDISRIREEFGFRPRRLLEQLPSLASNFKEALGDKHRS